MYFKIGMHECMQNIAHQNARMTPIISFGNSTAAYILLIIMVKCNVNETPKYFLLHVKLRTRNFKCCRRGWVFHFKNVYFCAIPLQTLQKNGKSRTIPWHMTKSYYTVERQDILNHKTRYSYNVFINFP